MAFKTEVLKAIGGFDNALDTGAPLPGGGDLDIFYRVNRAGYAIVYEPWMLVRHEHRESMEQLRRQYWSWGLGFFSFWRKSYATDPKMRPALRKEASHWLRVHGRELLSSVLKRNDKPTGMVLAEMLGGLQGFFGEYHRSQRRIAHFGERYLEDVISGSVGVQTPQA